jgi:hypothetical protein
MVPCARLSAIEQLLYPPLRNAPRRVLSVSSLQLAERDESWHWRINSRESVSGSSDRFGIIADSCSWVDSVSCPFIHSWSKVHCRSMSATHEAQGNKDKKYVAGVAASYVKSTMYSRQ